MFKNKRTGVSLTKELEKMTKQVINLVGKELPQEAESKLGEIVTESFRQEKYIDTNNSKWKGRKGEKVKKQKARRNTLVNDGNLAAAPQTFSGKGFAGVRLADDGKKNGVTTYGPVHNEGLRAGRGKGVKMPKRQFMPIPGEHNKKLTKHMFKYIDKKGDKIFNKK